MSKSDDEIVSQIDYLNRNVHVLVPFSVFERRGVRMSHAFIVNGMNTVEKTAREMAYNDAAKKVEGLTKTWGAVRKQIAKNNKKRALR